MYAVEYSLIVGADTMQPLGDGYTYETAIDKILDCRNDLREWSSAEFVLLHGTSPYMRFILDDSGLRKVEHA